MEQEPKLPQMPSLPPLGSVPAAPALQPVPQPPPQAADPFKAFDAALNQSLNAAIAGGLDSVQSLAQPPVPPPVPVPPPPFKYALPEVSSPEVPGTV